MAPRVLSLPWACGGHCILLGVGAQGQDSTCGTAGPSSLCALQPETQPSCLLLLKGAGSEGGGVPSCWKAGLKGPHPGASQMTRQGHTEASSQEEGVSAVLSGRLSAVWKALAPSLPVSSWCDQNPGSARPTPFLLHTSGFGLLNSGSRPRAYL